MNMKEIEMKKLQKVAAIFSGYFHGLPEVLIDDSGTHCYLSIGWCFLISFNEEDILTLSFDQDTDPLLAASIVQILQANQIYFVLEDNFYFSPSDQKIYYGNEIGIQKSKDIFHGQLNLKKNYGRPIQ